MKLGCLNERAVMCKGWRWLPGMLTMDGVRIYAVEGEFFDGFDADSEYNDHPVEALEWPDFTDAATRGCLLELVRHVWDDRTMTPSWVPSRQRWRIKYKFGQFVMADSETEVLVRMLEARVS